MASEQPDVVIGGGLRVDFVISPDGQARLGMLGGNAIYAAVGAAVWSKNVGLWGRAGRNYPFYRLSELEDAGVLCDGLVRLAEEHEHRTFYAYTADGKRVDTDPEKYFGKIDLPLPSQLEGYTISTPGQDDLGRFEPLALRPEDWPPSYDNAIGVHLAPISIRSHLELPTHLRQRGVRYISVDPGERYMKPEMSEVIKRLLPMIDVFLPSEDEVQSLLGEKVAPLDAARYFSSWGVGTVIIKRAEQGVLLYDGPTDRYWEVPAYYDPQDRKVVDVTGAGDAFCGGFVAGFVEGKNALQSALQGQVSASMVVESYGASYGLRFKRRQGDIRLGRLLTKSGI